MTKKKADNLKSGDYYYMVNPFSFVICKNKFHGSDENNVYNMNTERITELDIPTWNKYLKYTFISRKAAIVCSAVLEFKCLIRVIRRKISDYVQDIKDLKDTE